jgi:hypothetical protein
MCVCSAVVHLDCFKLNNYYCPLCHTTAWPLAEDGANEEQDEEGEEDDKGEEKEEEKGGTIDLTGI